MSGQTVEAEVEAEVEVEVEMCDLPNFLPSRNATLLHTGVLFSALCTSTRSSQSPSTLLFKGMSSNPFRS